MLRGLSWRIGSEDDRQQGALQPSASGKTVCRAAVVNVKVKVKKMAKIRKQVNGSRIAAVVRTSVSEAPA